MKRLFVLLLTIPLGGCLLTDGSVQSLKPICDALGPPIMFNAKDKNSAYHAGPKLVPRLVQQDAVGENLPCPGY